MNQADLPPQVTEPLAPFAGERPPAPEWFDWAIAQEPERFAVEVQGVSIECLAWGERGKPGIVFVHGASAHADWWSFIAPFFAEDYRVAALSLSGMGGSDWRGTYAYQTYIDEIEACSQAAGLYDSGTAPVYVGHSFGGGVVYLASLAHPERMSRTLMVDTGFSNLQVDAATARREPPRMPTGRSYASLKDGLARFRLLPPQEPLNLYIADFIARRSLKPVVQPDGQTRWAWRFDPLLFPNLDRSALAELQTRKPRPMVHIYGNRSLVASRTAERLGPLAEALIPVVIPDCAHHVMIDQPLALVSALRACLARGDAAP